MKSNDQDKESIAWGSTRIDYRIMTDEHGVKWKVPTHIDGEPCIYLTKFDPSQKDGQLNVVEK